MKSSTGLKTVQEESVQRLYARMIRTGWTPDTMAICGGPSIVCLGERGEQYFAFHQLVLDGRVPEKFTFYRGQLPAHYRVNQLPLDRVGALATLNLEAFAEFTDSRDEDFIAIAFGTLKLRLWGIVTANAAGADLFARPPTQGLAEGEVLSTGWRQSSVLAVAGDVLGFTWDHERVAKIVAWDRIAGDLGGREAEMYLLLEAFVVYHEIGHYELRHGDRLRDIAAAGRSPLRPGEPHDGVGGGPIRVGQDARIGKR